MSRLLPRRVDKQLRTAIIEILLDRCFSQLGISEELGISVIVVRAELLHLTHVGIVQSLGFLYEEDPVDDPYFRERLWTITQHGRHHLDVFEHPDCGACRRRQLSDYRQRP